MGYRDYSRLSEMGVESDYHSISCDLCGKESGSFYQNDDGDTLCMDCVLELPTQERKDFEEALAKSKHWELHHQRNGMVTLRCVECCEVHDDGPWDEDDDGYVAMEEILSADSPHECEEDDDPVETDLKAFDAGVAEAQRGSGPITVFVPNTKEE